MIPRFTVVTLLAIFVIGCKKDPPPIVPVTGVVTLDGQPLAKAEVRFYPQQEGLPGDYIGIAVTDDQGRYSLITNGQPGGCACVCKVTVAEGPPPDDARSPEKFDRYKATLKNRPIPPKYGMLNDDVLTITVTAGQSDYPIALTR